jgi:hypothetical protein
VALFFRNIVRVSHVYVRNRRKAVSEQVAIRNWNKQVVVTFVPGLSSDSPRHTEYRGDGDD